MHIQEILWRVSRREMDLGEAERLIREQVTHSFYDPDRTPDTDPVEEGAEAEVMTDSVVTSYNTQQLPQARSDEPLPLSETQQAEIERQPELEKLNAELDAERVKVIEAVEEAVEAGKLASLRLADMGFEWPLAESEAQSEALYVSPELKVPPAAEDGCTDCEEKRQLDPSTRRRKRRKS